MNNLFSKDIVIRNSIINTARPIIMAVINITPDSFYKNSRVNSETDILNAAEKALEDGATILDIGGYSSRPGADFVSEEQETKRIAYALNIIKNKFPQAPISVDTFRSRVAEIAVHDFGIDMINDISGGELDKNMFPTVAKLNVPYILMHMKGTPETMQQLTTYEDLISEMLSYFSTKIKQLRHLEFTKEIIIDPGFGFAKTTKQNFEILRNLTIFETFKAPILVGISRKTMIWKTLNITPDEALNGTTVINTIALMNGANILRVHDVKEAKEAITLWEQTFDIQPL